MNNNEYTPVLFHKVVEKGLRDRIETRFQTLIQRKCEAPFDWYKELGLHKSYASRVRRGLTIPPEWMRIKIAQHFDTDSSTIWKIPEIISADRIQGEQHTAPGAVEPQIKKLEKIKMRKSNETHNH